MTTFSELANLDLKKVPDHILIVIQQQIEFELQKRRKKYVSRKKIFSDLRGRIKSGEKNERTQNDLLIKDWDDLYQNKPGDTRSDFYVYAHIEPDQGCFEIKTNESQWVGIRINGLPFYIGKGTGARAYDLNRNQGHGAKLKSLLRSGVDSSEIVCILAESLTEQEAFKLESQLIYFFITKYESNSKGVLVNLDLPKIPKCLEHKRL